jgi:chemotaxis protein MotA
MHSLIGALICFAVFVASFLFTGQAGVYFNLVAFLVVVSGTAGSILLSCGREAAIEAFRAARAAYGRPAVSPREIIAAFIRQALRLKRYDCLRLDPDDPTLTPALRGALELIEDNYRVSEMREILSAELHQAAARGEARERVFRSMAAYAPAYGVAGSVTGLIALLLGLGDTAVILKSIPVALVSTLYGVVAANFFFMPAAEKVRQATEQELVIHALILEGTLALSRKPNARRLARRLNSLVDPSERMSEEAALKAARSLKLGPLELAEDVPAEPVQSLG